MNPLGSFFLSAARQQGPHTDVLWRNVNYDEILFAGVSPSETLLTEIIMLNEGNGERMYRLGRLLVGDINTSRALDPNSSVDLLRGIMDGATCKSDTLRALQSHADPAVSKMASERLTYLDGLVSGASDTSRSLADREKVINELMTSFNLESITAVLEASPEAIVYGLNRIVPATETNEPDRFVHNSMCPASRNSWLHRMSILNGPVYDKVLLCILRSEYGFVDGRVAGWAVGQSNGMEYLEGLGKNIQAFTKRCDPAARDILMKRGLVRKPAAEKAPAFTSLDSMVNLLEPNELGALFFSTFAKVGSNTSSHILDSVSVPMVANFMFGLSMRKPEAGEITAMLHRWSADRRMALAETLMNMYTGDKGPDGASPHGEHVAYLPWADELLLAFSRLHVSALSEDTAAKLFASVVDVVGVDAESWEYLMVLSNEWQSTFVDLLASAAAIVR